MGMIAKKTLHALIVTVVVATVLVVSVIVCIGTAGADEIPSTTPPVELAPPAVSATPAPTTPVVEKPGLDLLPIPLPSVLPSLLPPKKPHK